MEVVFCALSIIIKTYTYHQFLYSGIQLFCDTVLPVHLYWCFGICYTSEVDNIHSSLDWVGPLQNVI